MPKIIFPQLLLSELFGVGKPSALTSMAVINDVNENRARENARALYTHHDWERFCESLGLNEEWQWYMVRIGSG